MHSNDGFIPYRALDLSAEQSLQEAEACYLLAATRRSIRHFSTRVVDQRLIELLVRTACTAPSGANKQPWTFCLVSDPDMKRAIREAAETEEYESYSNRMSAEWIEDLRPLGTDWHKPFLEDAPWLIAVFRRIYEQDGEKKRPNYYVSESVGIACGMLIHAIHRAGLVTLTHTPSPMNFLSSLLGRPDNERPYLLLPVGYPASGAAVPAISRKTFEECAHWYTKI